MTREQFREWAIQARTMFSLDGADASTTRAFASDVRPHDPVLASLFVRCAEANEAVRAHVARPT